MTQLELQALFSYSPETGLLTWKVSLSNRTKAGDTVRGKSPDGYYRVGIHGKVYLAHRIIWVLIHGSAPQYDIDHIDGDPSNNRLDNLRDVSRSANITNQHKRRPKTNSPLKGAYWDKNAKRYMSQITVNGQRKYLGYFDTAEQAHEAYMASLRDALLSQTVAK